MSFIKNNTGIDIFKFLMAIIVVAIHTHPFVSIKNETFLGVWNVVIQMAVPFFFISSGYLLYSKINVTVDKNAQKEVLKSYTRKIAKLYIYWNVIYLPLTIWKLCQNDATWYKNVIQFARSFFLVGGYYFSVPLWYLLSLLISLSVIYFMFLRGKNVKTMFYVALVLFVISLFIDILIDNKTGNTHLNQLGNILRITIGSGRLFSGMLYVVLGALLSTTTNLWNFRNVTPPLLIALLFQIIQVEFISKLTFVILPVLIFVYSLQVKTIETRKAFFLRKSSTVIYFTHMLVVFVMATILKESPYFGFHYFTLAVLIPILLTPLILKLEKTNPIIKQIF